MVSRPAAVVFDMGGVLVEIGPFVELFGAPQERDEQLRAAWLRSEAVRAHESGRCTVDEFAAALVDEMSLEMTAAEFQHRFEAWPRGLLAGAAAMVASLTPRCAVSLLSNTSDIHWRTQPDAVTIQALCPRNYLSYEMHMLKPDAEIYEAVIADLGVPAGDVLFLDDNQPNVDGARRVGMAAELVRGVAAAQQALAHYGLR